MKRLHRNPLTVLLGGVVLSWASANAQTGKPIGEPIIEPIVIGVSTAQSPPGSVVQGTEIRQGMEIMVKHLNDQGGVLGRPLRLVVEDSQGIPEKGRAAVEKLITREQAVAITGAHQSSVCLAEIEVAHHYGRPYVNTECWSDEVRAKGYPEVFSPSAYNTRVSEAMAQTIAALQLNSVVVFAENTDYGVGQARLLGEFLKAQRPGIDYRQITLDRAGKDYTPAVLALRAVPPDMVVSIMLPPAGYLLMNQLYERGVAPSAKTWLYDGAGAADHPDFWDNVGEAGRYTLVFGLYHPKMALPPLGEAVAQAYTQQYQHEANRLILQGADSIWLIARAIEHAQSTDSAAMVAAMQALEFDGVRGRFRFSQGAGYRFQQWLDVPYVIYQLTEVGQTLADTALIQATGEPLRLDLLQRPVR